MEKIEPAISIARQLHQHDLFYFTPQILRDLFDLDRPRAYRVLEQLKQTNLIAEVENGKYLLLGFEPERVLANPLFIASHLVIPGYVSYWSALHYYGFSEQVPFTSFVATTKRKRPVTFRNFRFRFVSIQPYKCFGYRRDVVGELPVLIADEAKAIIDSLDQMRYAGGITEVASALRTALNLDAVDVATLIDYANRMRDKSLGTRLGYLLETLGQPMAHLAEPLIQADSPIKLDPTRPARGTTDPRWHVRLNVSPGELFSQGVG